jgi:UDP-glucose 4-epimerase
VTGRLRPDSQSTEAAQLMRILITGATGFIGRRLVARLRDHHEVLALVRERQGTPDPAVSEVVMDLAQHLNTSLLPSSVDVVIHLAQANVSFPDGANELFAVNTSSTQQLLDYARGSGTKQFILASTGDVYGKRFGPSKETDAVHPESYYGKTKHAAESFAQAYSGYIHVCILRLYQPYGPGQSDRLIPRVADRIRRHEVIKLNEDARPRVTPIYIDDVTHAIERAMDSSFAGAINVAGDRAVNLRELASEIGRIVEIEPNFETTGEKSSDLMGDNSLMKQVLGGWDMVGLEDGLLRTLGNEGGIAWQGDR